MAMVDLRYLKILDVIKGFMDENNALQESLAKDIDASINDSVNMIRMLDGLYYLHYHIEFYVDLQCLIVDVENEKDRFLVQKRTQGFFEYFKEELNIFIKEGRTWKCEDYRCIDWIKRLTDAIVEIKDFFENNKVAMDKSVLDKME